MFSHGQIKQQPTRWFGVACGFLPLVLIFGASAIWPVGESEAVGVVGRPTPAVFATVWVGITGLLLLSSTVAALHFDQGSLIAHCVGTAAVSLVSAYWLKLNHEDDKSSSVQYMGILSAVSMVLGVVNICAETTVPGARALTGSCALLVSSWSIFAGSLGLVANNSK